MERAKWCTCGHSIEDHMELGSSNGRGPACAGNDCECMQFDGDPLGPDDAEAGTSDHAYREAA